MSALVSHDNLPADATLSGGVGGDDGGGAAPVNRCRHRVEHVCGEVRDAGDGRPSEEHGRRWLPTSAHTSCSVAQSGVLHEAIAEGSAVKCINLICQLGQELFVLEERKKKILLLLFECNLSEFLLLLEDLLKNFLLLLRQVGCQLFVGERGRVRLREHRQHWRPLGARFRAGNRRGRATHGRHGA